MRAPSVCWDSTVFIAVMTGERRSDEEMAGLAEAIELIDSDKLVVVTSSMATIEVLNHSSDKATRQRFEALFKSPRFFRADVTAPIAEKARYIRENLPKGLKLKGEDSTFIATAIVHGCNALHTFDHHQLKLNGLRCVEGLRSCIPEAAKRFSSDPKVIREKTTLVLGRRRQPGSPAPIAQSVTSGFSRRLDSAAGSGGASYGAKTG